MSTPNARSDEPRRERWSTLFQHSTRPLFVLYRSRRIQYVNAAWEALSKCAAADAIGRACVRSGRVEPVFRTLAPPPEARDGAIARVRRPAPGAKGGPPWWDITFVPLKAADGTAGYLGAIDFVQVVAPIPPRKTPPAVMAIREQQSLRFPFDLFAGESAAAQRFQSRLRLAAKSTEPVWIVGEPGSGKETLARVVHHQSPAREKAFVVCECRGVQPYLLDGVLFGIAGIATAGQVGTLFLKSPAALPRDAQQRILDWLRIAPFPPRLISASAESAANSVRSGTLHDAFLAEQSTIELEMPPLRDRTDELFRIVERMGFPLSVETPAMLIAHDWPGNLRELHEILTESALRAGGGPIAPEHLPRYVRERAMLANNPLPSDRSLPLDALLEAVERRMIESAMKRSNGNQTEAAARLGIFRTRLGRRIEALKIKT
jgi:transcriptional regulator with PAS, ATPase and Fis domain